MSTPTSPPSTCTEIFAHITNDNDQFEEVFEGIEGRVVRRIPKTSPFSKDCIPTALSCLKDDHFASRPGSEYKIPNVNDYQTERPEINQEPLLQPGQTTSEAISASSNPNLSQSYLGQITAKISGISSYLWPGNKNAEK